MAALQPLSSPALRGVRAPPRPRPYPPRPPPRDHSQSARPRTSPRTSPPAFLTSAPRLGADLVHLMRVGRVPRVVFQHHKALRAVQSAAEVGFPGGPQGTLRDRPPSVLLGRRGLTPRVSLECNPEIPAFPVGKGRESHTEVTHSGSILHLPTIQISRGSSNPPQQTHLYPTWKRRNVEL